MTSSFWRIIVAVIAVTAAAESESFACSCMPSGPPCQAAWDADVISAGTVLSIESVADDASTVAFHPKVVKFRVDRAFISAPSGQAEVVTDGATCGYRFVLGGKYLVYAWKTSSSRLSTGICSRTRPTEEAEEDIRYLTMVGTAPPRSRVYGRVNERRGDPAEPGSVDFGPLEGITVSVRGDTFARDTITDANGRFEITGLPLGKATLTSTAPFGYEPSIFERDIEIRDPRACSEVNFSISQVALASGVVVDASGRPVAGVEVDAVAAELAGFAPPPYQRPVRTDEHGRFEFRVLPPGVYVFGVNLTKLPRGPSKGIPLFLPGTRAAAEATVVELRAGDRKDLGVLRLTEP